MNTRRNPIFRAIADVLFQPQCALCDRPSHGSLCADCQRQIEAEALRDPRQFWRGELPVFAWGRYSGQLKRAIAALKYENRPDLARPLGAALGQTWENTFPRALTKAAIVPIPLHDSKLQERGFNQAHLLAAAFCRQTSLPLVSNGLVRQRETTAQFGLSKGDRQRNVSDAFVVEPPLLRQGERVILLLDDIYTTGATLQAAAATISQAGVTVGGAIVLAAAQASARAAPDPASHSSDR